MRRNEVFPTFCLIGFFVAVTYFVMVVSVVPR